MKWLIIALSIFVVYLQYRLWVGEGSLAEVVGLQDQIKLQQQEIDELQERNRILALEVNELKTGVKTIEERARTDMGMIKEGETFYIVVDEDDLESKTNSKPSSAKPAPARQTQ